MLKQTYQKKIDKYTEIYNSVRKKQKIIAWIRLLVFVLAIIVFFVFVKQSYIFVPIIVLVIFAGLFLYLILIHTKQSSKNKFYKNLIEINKEEIKFLNFDYSEQYTGKDFIEPEHPYENDLDVLGQHSLFQYINRTTTSYGLKKLVKWLKSPIFAAKKIIKRQKAINELIELIDFRQSFQAYGKLENDPISDKDGLLEWIKSKNYLQSRKFLKILSFGLPALFFILLIVGAWFPYAYSFVSLIIVLNLTVLGIHYRNLKKIHDLLTKKYKILNKYSKQLSLIEEQTFISEHLIDLKSSLFDGKISAKNEIKQLQKILNLLDTRNNMLLTFMLNSMLLFDFHIFARLEKWKNKNSENLENWLNTLGKFDALFCFSNFAYNNKEQICFPKCNTENFVIHANSMGHPLIPIQDRVCNDFNINGFQGFNIVTGANMAGKSTFLRTLGVNLILAMAGSPVIASEFEFYPINIRTRIKITDSLFKNESYFYAELKRLKSIMLELQQGKEIFLLLDEILRGTNSQDKHKGSKKYIEKLLNYKVSGIIATHDVVLGKLQDEYPEQIQNYCFEVEIANDNLVFDYKLKSGISQKLNASFLMKKMEII